MRTGWTCRGCDRADEDRLRSLWQTREDELQARLPHRSGGRIELQLALEHGGDCSEWDVRAALFLPGRTCVAQAASESPEAALDQIGGELVRALEAHNGLDGQPAGSPLTRQTFQAVSPLLERFAETANGGAFLAFLRPLVKSLEGYVRRELRILIRDRALPAAQVTAADVLDEALVRCWERFDRRPRDLPLDAWLVRLIEESLNEFARGAAHESIERRMPLPTEEPHSSWDDTWVARAGEPESIGFAELLPGRPGIDVWDRLDADSHQAALTEMLAQLSRPQRQALIFHAVEGYDPAEIADFQDRPVEEVLADIATARQILWHQTEGEDGISDIEQRFARAGGRPARRRRK
ncbi:MAG TPA: sigma factor-like helix-turn-helix DNA-binding protein [Planctomycetaceae bacterium]|nr:sigma factor-like helix-turn-helix DNA-binding protein [Planctomycetaceae bacterium]